MTTLLTQKLYINGQNVDATSGKEFASVNPATGEIICNIEVASQADVDRTVEAAKNAQESVGAF